MFTEESKSALARTGASHSANPSIFWEWIAELVVKDGKILRNTCKGFRRYYGRETQGALHPRRLRYANSNSVEARRYCVALPGSDAVGWVRWFVVAGREEPIFDGPAPFALPSRAPHFESWIISQQKASAGCILDNLSGVAPKADRSRKVRLVRRNPLLPDHGPTGIADSNCHYQQGQIVPWELNGLNVGCQCRGLDLVAELVEPQ